MDPGVKKSISTHPCLLPIVPNSQFARQCS